MSFPLTILRPQPGWSATAALARARGLEVAGEPLFAIEPVAWEVPEASDFDAILAGSANAFRHGGAGLQNLAALPVIAVGDATAEAARSKGFQVAETGAGGLQALLDSSAGRFRRLLRLAGEARVALDAPAECKIVERIVYRVRDLPLSRQTAGHLRGGGVVALHSGRAADHFREECDRLRLDRSLLSLVALAPRVAGSAGAGWRGVEVCAAPHDAALLALAESLCKKTG